MHTLYVHPENPQARLINDVVAVLNAGQAVILPTAFGYGLAIGLNSQKTFDKLSTYINSIPHLICRDVSDLSKFASLDNNAFTSVRAGLKQAVPPIFLLPATKDTPKFLGKKSIHITTSDNPIHLALLDSLHNAFIVLPLNDDNRHSDYEMGEQYGHLADTLISVGEIEVTEMAVENLL